VTRNSSFVLKLKIAPNVVIVRRTNINIDLPKWIDNDLNQDCGFHVVGFLLGVRECTNSFQPSHRC